MRILLPTDGFPPNRGGVGWSSYYLAKALIKEGYEVHVVVPKKNIVGTSSGNYGKLKVTFFGYNPGWIPVLKNRNVNEIFWKSFQNFLDGYLERNKIDL